MPEPLTATDLGLMNRLVDVAREHHDGHVTIMRFTTSWRVGFSTPSDRFDIGRMSSGATFEEAAQAALADPRSLFQRPSDDDVFKAKMDAQHAAELGLLPRRRR